MTKIPEVNLVFRIYDEFNTKSTYSEDLFKGKRVVVFSLPGAFTPTCSTKQLPSYDKRYKEFTDLGIDEPFGSFGPNLVLTKILPANAYQILCALADGAFVGDRYFQIYI